MNCYSPIIRFHSFNQCNLLLFGNLFIFPYTSLLVRAHILQNCETMYNLFLIIPVNVNAVCAGVLSF